MKNTTLKLNTIIGLISIALALTSCLGSNNGIPSYTVSNEFAQYCWFQQGSIWVYQNDSTLASDSVIIEEIFESKRFNPESVDYNYQAVEMFTNSNLFDIDHQEITAGNFAVEPGKMNSLLRFYYGDGSYQLIFASEYPIGEEVILGDVLGVYSNAEIVSSMELNGTTYSDVYHSKIVISVNNNIEYNFWIAKNYGLIKSTADVNGVITSISLKSSNLIPKAS